ncbi:hypothetical protein SLEP1_g24952 [Rubroshorea leprosula]|uniref:Uncharacterized protein n=1 Tax=Rubroshorea leprosula TaxID=152421 RepID=A0AAV5JMN4_9ROSI|nr:hypothetical protein SLEP1_g24952 [Rubroshorea leprosula]
MGSGTFTGFRNAGGSGVSSGIGGIVAGTGETSTTLGTTGTERTPTTSVGRSGLPFQL